MDGTAMLEEFDREMATTRKALGRVPMEKADWKPHERSFSLGDLANHIADIPSWTAPTIQLDVMELEGDYRPETADTTDDLLALFDRRVAEARAALKDATADDLSGTWSLVHNGETTFTAPKPAVLRSFVFSHAVHHRAQLGVYLRLLGIPVPATYGPSADEE